MKERPILFSTPMVQAILAGRKTQTRRIVKTQKPEYPGIEKFVFEGGLLGPEKIWYAEDWAGNLCGVLGNCPYGKPGDILWVRETWKSAGFDMDNRMLISYKDGLSRWVSMRTDYPVFMQNKWKPSIHMPKAAARIWLKVTSIRIERLNVISEDDAKAEGIEWHIDEDNREQFYCYQLKETGHVRTVLNVCVLDNSYVSKGIFDIENPAQFSYRTLWDSINGFDSWKSNPWVWVVEFEVLSTTGRP